jgi:hypothetical protein
VHLYTPLISEIHHSSNRRNHPIAPHQFDGKHYLKIKSEKNITVQQFNEKE